uniref:Acylglycerol kinase, mitochondrial n=1 Tax=Megaselia scalaris TaxID=36166 RepID=T1GI02_MEGSC
FQDYCEPILNLGGFTVDIIRTDSEGHAKRYIEECFVVAGGDGTVSEVITGLLRRNDHTKCPLGILPVGRSNDTAKSYFNLNLENDVQKADELAKTALLILKGKKERKNLLKIQPITEENETKRPIYALNQFQWGAFRDTLSLKDKYWYYGPFRHYAAVFFNCLSKKLTWDCEANLQVTPPCSGCRNCYMEEVEENPNESGSGRWWGRYVPKAPKNSAQNVDYSKVINEDCLTTSTQSVKTSEVLIKSNVESPARLHLETTTSVEPGIDFIKESWNRLFSEEVPSPSSVVEGRTITLVPQTEEKYQDKFFYIDNEEYEVRPVKINIFWTPWNVIFRDCVHNPIASVASKPKNTKQQCFQDAQDSSCDNIQNMVTIKQKP